MAKGKDKQIAVKVICVIAAFVLWIYVANVENPEQTKHVNVPVKLENLDLLETQGITLLPGQQNLTVAFNLRGPLSEINKVTAADFEVAVDLNAYKYPKGEWPVRLDIRKRPPNIDIVNDQQVIKLNFDDFVDKIVPVKTEFEVDVKSGYMALTPIPQPANVHVRGAAQYVNTVSYALAKATQKGEVDTNVQMSVPLKAYDDGGRIINDVNIQPNLADVSVPVKKTKTVGIVVKTKGTLNGDLILKVTEASPDKIDIAGDAAVLNNINSLDTEPIDLAGISGSTTKEVNIIVPDKITRVNSNGTVSVKITVEKIITKPFSGNIIFNNLGADYTMSSDKTTASFIVRGPESKINALGSDDIKFIADLSNLGEGNDYTVQIVPKLPEGLNYDSLNPKSVKVSITKKAAPTSANPGGTNNGGGTGGTGGTTGNGGN